MRRRRLFLLLVATVLTGGLGWLLGRDADEPSADERSSTGQPARAWHAPAERRAESGPALALDSGARSEALPSVVWSGIVTDNLDAPLSDVTVDVFGGALADPEAHARDKTPAALADAIDELPLAPRYGSVKSDAQGRFTVSAPPEAWAVAVRGNLFGMALLRGPRTHLIVARPRQATFQLVDLSGRPLVGVPLSVFDVTGGWRRTTRTGLDGLTTLDAPSLRFWVTARPDGFVPVADARRSSSEPIRLEASPPGSLEVTVLRDGRPVSAMLTAQSLGARYGRSSDLRQLSTGPSTVRLTGLRHERYALEVDDGEAAAMGSVSIPADTAITLELTRKARLALSVAADGGSGRALVSLSSAASEKSSQVDVGGPAWEVDMPHGEVLLLAAAEGYQSFRKVLSLTPGRQELTVTLEPRQMIHGRVLAADGTPAAGAGVSILTSRLEVADSTTSDATGEFRLALCAPPLVLRAVGEGGTATASFDGLPTSPVELVLEPSGLEVRAQDERGAPIPAARATAWEGSHDARCVTDEHGRCWLERMECARSRVWVAARDRVSAVARCDDAGTVAVATLEPGGDVTGRVVDERGRPIAVAKVTLSLNEDDEPESTTTGPDGRFGFGEIPYEKQARLAAAHGSCPKVRVAVRAPAANVSLSVRRAKRIHGRVVGLDGGTPRLLRVKDLAVVPIDGTFDTWVCDDSPILDGFGAGSLSLQLPEAEDVDLGELHLGTAISPPPDTATLVELARVHLRQDSPHALPLLDFCVAQNPAAFDCHKLRGITLAKAGDGPEGLRAYRAFLAHAPADHPSRRAVEAVVRDYEGR